MLDIALSHALEKYAINLGFVMLDFVTLLESRIDELSVFTL